jgi:hypothetical protein
MLFDAKRFLIHPAVCFLGAVLLLTSKSASAEVCSAGPSTWVPGGTNEVHYKVKVGSVCSYILSPGSNRFEGVEVIEQPKGLVEILNNPYALAFRMKKAGKYTLKAKFNIVDRYNKRNSVVYVFYIEAVPNAW